MMIGLVGFILGLLIVGWMLRNVNSWVYERNLSEKIRYNLPPGDFGWPFIGVMWPFLRAFKFGQTGVYKAHMFGNPSVVVTSAEACKKVLTDDEGFNPGWPTATVNLIGRKSFVRHLRRRAQVASQVNRGPGERIRSVNRVHEIYRRRNVIVTLDKWADMGQIELLTELRRLTFKIIMHIFLSSESEHVREALEREYTMLNHEVRAMAINIPGFVYYNALKARKNLVSVLQAVVTKRREQRRLSGPSAKKADMMDALLDAEDENGKTLSDEEIIDILVMYLNAGHESSGHTTMWAALYLHKNPDAFKRAKAEQEEIVRNRPADQKGLTLREIRKMDYLNKVIDETLRMVTFSLMVFREAKKDVNVCGYTIPKGWKVLVWFRNVHFDPKTYPDPMKFDPSRWDGFTPKAGNFLPFGGGS
ncbi:ent-kaurenoic acid oxidase 1 [Phtheirospermum japonicum]|uniref:Ent-kaurenoic acid oxidase 1 n=1 Tax=Phtheirospermum japonicum TaxID=374723 RepID=A0A830C2I8_9LAMI|nr:ent-kaurenoic acid oxidase 1 [Phtheirospermum japonicum]